MAIFGLEINGVDYSGVLMRATVSISETLQSSGAKMGCTLNINGNEIAAPLAGQYIEFTQDGGVEFAGRITNVDEDQAAASNMHHFYVLDCVDHTIDLDNELLVAIYEAQLAGDMVRTIVGAVGRGFTSVGVEDGPPIGEIEVDLEHPSHVINNIAESVEYQWFVDYGRDVNFFYILEREAPIPLINLDTDTDTYFDAELSEDWSQVKNVLYLTGGKAKSSGAGGGSLADNIVKVGDGGTLFYPLNYEPWSIEDTTVTVDGIPQEILLDTIDGQAGDGLGEAGQVFLCIDNWGVRFPDAHPPGTDPDNTLPVEIDYAYAYEPVVQVEDPDSIAAMMARENYVNAPSNGRHEFKFDIPDLRVTTEAAIIDYGNLILQRYSTPIRTVTFGSWIQGWQVGQFVRVFSDPARRNVDEVFYITNVGKSVLTAHNNVALLQYEITAHNKPYPG
jgi:hypothetical protein